MNKMKNVVFLSKLALGMALCAVVFYFLHVLLGTINYPGYDTFSQAVSDLTADDSPSKTVARLFSSFYGLLSSLVSIVFIYLFKDEKVKVLKFGVYTLSMMYIISAIGYALFPLSDQTFQNHMHIVVTVVVVLLTIISLILLMISFNKMGHSKYFYITVVAFVTMMLGAILTNIVPASYFGLTERMSVYTVVIYLLVISYFSYRKQQVVID